jgi:hypothetical protein
MGCDALAFPLPPPEAIGDAPLTLHVINGGGAELLGQATLPARCVAHVKLACALMRVRQLSDGEWVRPACGLWGAAAACTRTAGGGAGGAPGAAAKGRAVRRALRGVR